MSNSDVFKKCINSAKTNTSHPVKPQSLQASMLSVNRLGNITPGQLNLTRELASLIIVQIKKSVIKSLKGSEMTVSKW